MIDTNPDTVRRFLENDPLYKKVKLTKCSTVNFPRVLTISCTKCGGPRTYEKYAFNIGRPGAPGSPIVQSSNLVQIDGPLERQDEETTKKAEEVQKPPQHPRLRYRCTECRETEYEFLCRLSFSPETTIMKIGQYPPYDIEIPKEVSSLLGDETLLLSKARICVSQSYGLGACAHP